MPTLHFLDPNPSGHPPVLLLHGLGADGSSWTLQLAALTAAGFRPIAPDAPGFGQSSYDGRGWSIRRIAGQLADLLQGLGAGPVHVVVFFPPGRCRSAARAESPGTPRGPADLPGAGT